MADQPQNTDAAIKRSVQQSLTDQGWIALNSVAIATKGYATAVGRKRAYVFVSYWANEWVVTAGYDSQGRNILESLRVTLPETANADTIREAIAEFSAAIDARVAESYAVRLIRNQPQKRPFPLGITVATPGAVVLLQKTLLDPGHLLSRHACGDWGDLCDEDRALNEAALAEGGRLMSVYQISGQDTVWVITEADHSATTILLPDEY
ncbi:hypothetical protein ACH518_00235 (plasmid) [Methylomonas sp. HW2-6]|uniref:hypothetical protein n=1 Tax=Methylomonas sp. HW2-6 TaxID=3376687 RepID=UPI004042BD37